MVDQPNGAAPASAPEPRDYTPPMPEQLKRQLAQAEQIRTEMDANQPPPQADPPDPAATPPSPAGEDEPSWEQRYKSLQGRLENERKSNQALSERMQQLENTLTAMAARGEEAPSNEPPPPPPRPQLVTEQEAADYGEEMLSVVGKRAREEFAPEFEQLASRLKRLESGQQAVGKIIDSTQKQTVYEALASQVPNWRDINRAEEFKAWLAEPDQFSGRRRQDMIKEAFDRHESGRVVAFFKGFLTEATGTPPTSPSPGNAAPPLANGQNGYGNGSEQPSLEDFAAPGRARSAPQAMPPDKPIYTSAWIAKFMDDKRTGKFRGRIEEANAIERDIYQAQHEGRIQP